MKFYSVLFLALGLGTSALAPTAFAGIDGSISGTVTDDQGVPTPNVKIDVLKSDGTILKEVLSGPTGEYEVFPVTLGDYTISVNVPGFSPYSASIHVASGGNTQADVQIAPPVRGKEIVLNVSAKRHLVTNTAATSQKEISSKDIEKLPQGENIKLPTLIEDTVPGVVQGPFGQMFIRGNHANIQYQIDGVQLPDSPSNTFGEAFTPRNIDHMEVITGGIPAEYGDRLAAVVNIVTKSGPETPGGAAEVNYGSYNTFSPWATYGGSNTSGSLHYFASAQYSRTDRGLDTPQPDRESYNLKGGTDAIHDSSNGTNEFLKLDWLLDNENKLSVIGFNSYNYFQIPNYPSNFAKGDFFFNGYNDDWGNTFNYTPSTTNDSQSEENAYVEIVWKHTFTDHSFLQVAPYYKYSQVQVNNDLTNDLDAANNTSNGPAIAGAQASSLAENRHVNNFGGKADFTDRINDRNLFKMGAQGQASLAAGTLNVFSQCTAGANCANPAVQPSSDNSPENGFFESVYAQDEFTIFKPLTVMAGVRWDATQFHFSSVNSADYLIQPRIGITYLATDTTKVHVFYGRLFQPAPVENLRDTFVGTGATAFTLAPYDIKAEKDQYWEAGIAQQVGDQVVTLNTYYKLATDMLDDSQLLNTSIAQPYNFAHGYAYGVELSVSGKINGNWSDFGNYSYEVAKGQGISGGLFAFGNNPPPADWYTYLDHVQISTANAGVTYAKDYIYWTTDALFGSGLRTGYVNTQSLPAHFSFDTTVGYDFHGKDWWSKAKVSLDILNISNNGYPITISNGFNGSHYAAGREFFLHLTKEL